MSVIDYTSWYSAFSELTLNLMSSTDTSPDASLRAVVDRVQAITGAAWVNVVVVQRDQDGLRVETGASTDIDFTLNDFIRPDGLTDWIIKHGRPVIVRDKSRFDSDDYSGRTVNPKTNQEYAAILGIPLPGRELEDSGEKTAFGVFWLHFRQPQEFPDEFRSALEPFARLCTKIYEQKKIISRLELAGQELAKFQAFTSERPFRRLIEQVALRLDCHSAEFWIDDRASLLDYTHIAKLHGSEATRTDYNAEALPQSVNRWISNQELDPTIQPLIPPEEQTDYVSANAIQSRIIVPIDINKERRAVLFINYAVQRYLPVTDLEHAALKAFQRHLSAVVQHVEQFQLLEKQRQQLNGVYAVVEKVLGSDNLSETEVEKFLSIIAKAMKQEGNLDADDISIMIVYEASNQVDGSTGGRATSRYVGSLGVTETNRAFRENGFTAYLLNPGNLSALGEYPCIEITDTSDYPACVGDKPYAKIELNGQSEHSKQHYRGILGIPLRAHGDRPIGVIWFHYKLPLTGKRKITEEGKRTAFAYANLVATAYSTQIRSERRQRSIQALQKALDTITADGDEDQIWKQTVDVMISMVKRSTNNDDDGYHAYVATVDHILQELVFKEKLVSDKFFPFLQQSEFGGDSKSDNPIAVAFNKLRSAEEVKGGLGQVLLDLRTFVYSSDIDTDKPYIRAFRDDGASMLAVPVFVKDGRGTSSDNLIAILGIEKNTTKAFDAEDQKTVEALALHLGGTIALRRERNALLKLVAVGMENTVIKHELSKLRGVISEFKSKHGDSKTLGDAEIVIDQMDELLTRYQIELPDPRAERQECSLHDEIESFRTGTHTQSRKHAIDLHLQPVDDDIVIPIDEKWFEVILSLLFYNARTAVFDCEEEARKKVHITTKVDEESNRVTIEVKNYHVSVPAEYLHLICHEPIPIAIRQGKKEGRGIGVFMCARILEFYGGSLRHDPISNDDPLFPGEKGARFTIELPIKQKRK